MLLYLLSDLDDRLGYRGYQAAREPLTALLNDADFKSPDEKIDVLGYSLGGNHAQRLLFDHYPKISRLYTVNAPSVERTLADDFAERINNLPHTSHDADFTIAALRVKDDLAHFVGQRHLGTGIHHPLCKRELLQLDFTRSHDSENQFFVIDKMARHLEVVLSQPDASYVAERHVAQDFDRHVDNTGNSDAGFWENLRTTLGTFIVLPILKLFNALFSVLPHLPSLLSLHVYLLQGISTHGWNEIACHRFMRCRKTIGVRVMIPRATSASSVGLSRKSLRGKGLLSVMALLNPFPACAKIDDIGRVPMNVVHINVHAGVRIAAANMFIIQKGNRWEKRRPKR
jgi:hypothetical protein